MELPRPCTYRDLQRWLRTLDATQLDTPILVTPGADDYGGTDYVVCIGLIDRADQDPRLSGGYEGPVLLVTQQVKERQREEG